MIWIYIIGIIIAIVLLVIAILYRDSFLGYSAAILFIAFGILIVVYGFPSLESGGGRYLINNTVTVTGGPSADYTNITYNNQSMIANITVNNTVWCNGTVCGSGGVVDYTNITFNNQTITANITTNNSVFCNGTICFTFADFNVTNQTMWIEALNKFNISYQEAFLYYNDTIILSNFICSAGNYSAGFYANGTPICRDDLQGSGGSDTFSGANYTNFSSLWQTTIKLLANSSDRYTKQEQDDNQTTYFYSKTEADNKYGLLSENTTIWIWITGLFNSNASLWNNFGNYYLNSNPLNFINNTLLNDYFNATVVNDMIKNNASVGNETNISLIFAQEQTNNSNTFALKSENITIWTWLGGLYNSNISLWANFANYFTKTEININLTELAGNQNSSACPVGYLEVSGAGCVDNLTIGGTGGATNVTFLNENYRNLSNGTFQTNLTLPYGWSIELTSTEFIIREPA